MNTSTSFQSDKMIKDPKNISNRYVTLEFTLFDVFLIKSIESGEQNKVA